MHSLEPTIIVVPVEKLLDAERKSLHADFDAAGRDAWLVENIREHGVLVPLLIAPDYAVTKGRRRLRAAKCAGLAEVPCIVLRSDSDAAFASSQLGRPVKVFAKVVFYRERIVALMERGAHRRGHNTVTDPAKRAVLDREGEQTERDWIETEEVLGTTRRSLIRGVKLLQRLDEMSRSLKVADRDNAARALNTFRNRGLKPALRMLGEIIDADDAEPDCGDWEADDAPEPRTRRRSTAVDDAADAWAGKVARALSRLSNLLQAGGHDLPEVRNAIAAVERTLHAPLVEAA